MVTSYYIMEMTKQSKGMDIHEYYSNLHIKGIQGSLETRVCCRVCLADGSLPIFSGSDIAEALQIFANIEVEEGSDYPKHLCKICHKFIKCAILFRKTGQQSDEVLKKHIKAKKFDYFEDPHILVEESDIPDDSHINEDLYPVIPTEPTHKNKDKVKDAKVQCTICNNIVTSAYFKEHVTMHDPNHHKYVCDICGKSFRLRCSYHNHSLRHRTDFSFKCQLCPYKGRYKELLKNHMRTHTGDYRYMCTECPARFLFKSNLNRHVLIRHKAPEHHCNSCKKVFHTKMMLKSHYEAQHLGLKNHVCNICGKAFGYRNAMMKHQRHVHKREKLSFSRMPSYLQAENKNLSTEDD
ncbi:zinc finger protein 728-like [Pararge aegeria]|uniref:Jg4855 protein n=2 Tax=Pararge aegeria TaxID=116150 RepID=A0A8S4S5I5_9NEOP|nr:zinc finger protein 728-like [Pararge aegeria]CAH2245700.1 jg4855 [Pararge aegeria aegeria]